MSRPTKSLLREREAELLAAYDSGSVAKFNVAARKYIQECERYAEWQKDKSPRSQYQMPYRIRKMLGM